MDSSCVGRAQCRDHATVLPGDQSPLPSGAFPDVKAPTRRAARAALRRRGELVALAQVLSAFERPGAAPAERAPPAPARAERGSRLPSLEGLARRVDRCFEA